MNPVEEHHLMRSLLPEARRQREALRQSLFSPDASESGELETDRLLAILATMMVRIDVLERYLNSRVSLLGTHSEKYLVDEITVGIDDMAGSGEFHSVEVNEQGRSFAWTRVDRVNVLLPIVRTSPRLLSICALGVMGGEIHESLTISIDGEPCTTRFTPIEGAGLVSCELPAVADIGLTRLEIAVPRAVSPAALGVGDDQRSLGMAISEVSVKPVPRTRLQRLFARLAGQH